MSNVLGEKSKFYSYFFHILVIVFWCFAFYVTHLYHIGDVPGFHYDEAWFANRAAEMMNGTRSLFDLQGMSPFTTIFQSAFASLFLKFFGQTVAVFRSSEIIFVFVGFVFFHLTYRTILDHTTFPSPSSWWNKANWFHSPLWLFVALPYFSINHRFAIELTTTHVFFAGLSIYGFYRYYFSFNHSPSNVHSYSKAGTYYLFLHFASALLGFYNHLLFLALFVGIWVPILMVRDLTKLERSLFTLFVLCLVPRLFQIAVQVPEKDKAASLVAFVFFFGLWSAISGVIHPKIRFYAIAIVESCTRFLGKKAPLISIAWAILILFIPLFFLKSAWSIALITGQLGFERMDSERFKYILTMIPFVITVVCSIVVFASFYATKNKSNDMIAILPTQALTTTIMTLILSIKPTPRYFELSNLMFALSVSILWVYVGHGSLKKLRSLFKMAVFFSILSQMTLYSYGKLSKDQLISSYRNHSIQFLFFKDSSRDFSITQPIANALASKGCGLNNIQFSDPRTKESLSFMLPDLGISCSLHRLLIERCEDKVLGFCLNPELDISNFQTIH